MTQHEPDPGVLPTDRVTKQETVVLVRSLLVDWKVLEHIRDHGVGAEHLTASLRAACCKPDGGTCCVNAN
jgi:hypothetical protein